VRAARNKETPNKRLAIAAPVFAVVAALLSLVGRWPGIHLAGVAAACSIIAVLVSSFSNGGQIGMIFELYRNCAGYPKHDEDTGLPERGRRVVPPEDCTATGSA
jgi:hypothetical protein